MWFSTFLATTVHLYTVCKNYISGLNSQNSSATLVTRVIQASNFSKQPIFSHENTFKECSNSCPEQWPSWVKKRKYFQSLKDLLYWVIIPRIPPRKRGQWLWCLEDSLSCSLRKNNIFHARKTALGFRTLGRSLRDWTQSRDRDIQALDGMGLSSSLIISFMPTNYLWHFLILGAGEYTSIL